MKFIKITTDLPPFNKRVIFRAVDKLKSKKKDVFFDDELTSEIDDLEYGLIGYLLKDNTDYAVSDDVRAMEIYDSIVTHWSEIPEFEE
jgi:hypothetical protein